MHMSTPLRAITFDLWNTLIVSPEEVEAARVEARLEALTNALGEIGWPVERERLLRAYLICGEQHARVQARGQDIAAEVHVGLLLAALEPDGVGAITYEQHARIVEAYGRAALVAPPVLVDGAAMVLASCRQRGLRLGLISNTSRTSGRVLRQIMRNLEIYDAFNALIFSDEVGLAKPNPAIFARALAALGVGAAEAMHVGDDEILDSMGARGSGMRVILVSDVQPTALAPKEQWIQRLADLPQMLDQTSLSAT